MRSIITGIQKSVFAYAFVLLSAVGMRAHATPADELARACIKGDFGQAMELINDVININGYTLKGSTPLIEVARAGEFAGVMFLVSNGADVNHKAVNKQGTTPLIAAVRSGDERIVNFLLGKDANVNDCDSNQVTPLMAAAQAGDIKIVKILLNNRADVEGRDTETLHRIVQGRKPEPRAFKSSSPLLFAAEQGEFEICSLLVAKGAEINRKDKRGATPLMLAALLGEPRLVKLFIMHGADIDAEDRGNRTAADYAQTLASPEILFFLTRHGDGITDSIRFKQCSGLYRCETPTIAFGSDPYYLWFLEDGTVYGLATDADTSGLTRIFNVHNPDMAAGSWAIRGPYLHASVKVRNEGSFYFTFRAGNGDILDGTLNEGVLNADVRSSQQWATFAMKFSFVDIGLFCRDSGKNKAVE